MGYLCHYESCLSVGGEDFQGVIRELRFSSDGEWVVMIPILDNSPVELTEFFTARLATDNPFVIFNNNVSTVEIIDNDCRFLSPFTAADTRDSYLLQSCS